MKNKMKVELGREATNYIFNDKDEEEVSIKPQWIDHGSAPRDLITLLINIFYHKINFGLNLKTSTGN